MRLLEDFNLFPKSINFAMSNTKCFQTQAYLLQNVFTGKFLEKPIQS